MKKASNPLELLAYIGGAKEDRTPDLYNAIVEIRLQKQRLVRPQLLQNGQPSSRKIKAWAEIAYPVRIQATLIDD